MEPITYREEWMAFFESEIGLSPERSADISNIFHNNEMRRKGFVFLKREDFIRLRVTVEGDINLMITWIEQYKEKQEEGKLRQIIRDCNACAIADRKNIEEVLKSMRLHLNLVQIRTPLDEISRYQKTETQAEKRIILKNGPKIEKLKEVYPELNKQTINELATKSQEIAVNFFSGDSKSKTTTPTTLKLSKSSSSTLSPVHTDVELSPTDYVDYHFSKLKAAANKCTHEDKSTTPDAIIAKAETQYEEITKDIAFLSGKRETFCDENPEVPTAKQMKVMQPVFHPTPDESIKSPD